LDVEGGVPAIFVSYGECAVVARGVRIGEDLLSKCGFAGDVAPVLSKGDEELLIRTETADRRR
jgi:hypothetical protein